MFDSGAEQSLISVKAAGLLKLQGFLKGPNGQFVSQVEGKQAVGEIVECNFTFDSD